VYVLRTVLDIFVCHILMCFGSHWIHEIQNSGVFCENWGFMCVINSEGTVGAIKTNVVEFSPSTFSSVA
jgi:hypothetical protein